MSQRVPIHLPGQCPHHWPLRQPGLYLSHKKCAEKATNCQQWGNLSALWCWFGNAEYSSARWFERLTMQHTCGGSSGLLALVLALGGGRQQGDLLLRHLGNFLQEDLLQGLSHEDNVVCGLHHRDRTFSTGRSNTSWQPLNTAARSLYLPCCRCNSW